MKIRKLQVSNESELEATARLINSDHWEWHVANSMEPECGFVAIVDGRVVGYADSTPSRKLPQVRVHAERRRQGIGNALMEAIGKGRTLRLEVLDVEDSFSIDGDLPAILSFLRSSGWHIELEQGQFVRGPLPKGVSLLEVPVRFQQTISTISGL